MPLKTRCIFAVLLCAAACGGGMDPLGENADDATSATQLFTVRRDERKCAAPACGGFWASAVSQDASPAYVAELDLSRAGLDAASRQEVREAPAEELLFRARLGAADKRGLRRLLVKDAWRGMPGIVAAARDAIYRVAPRSPQVQCLTAPCNNQVATQLGSGKTTELTRVSAERAAKAFVDQPWLENRIGIHGALVAARVAAGKKTAGGTEVVLDASQVWLHLPESAGPCPMPRELACAPSQVQAYARTTDRCLLAVGCVTPGVCSRMQPSCSEGYVPTSWTSAPDGCPATVCDPAWVAR
jgi:hypothetical protein